MSMLHSSGSTTSAPLGMLAAPHLERHIFGSIREPRLEDARIEGGEGR